MLQHGVGGWYGEGGHCQQLEVNVHDSHWLSARHSIEGAPFYLYIALFVYICIYICLVCILSTYVLYIYIHIYMCVCVCVCIYIHIYMHTQLLQSYPTLYDHTTVTHQAPLSMGFSRQECWSRMPCPPPHDLPDPGIEPESLWLLHCRWIPCHWATLLGSMYMYMYMYIHSHTHTLSL